MMRDTKVHNMKAGFEAFILKYNRQELFYNLFRSLMPNCVSLWRPWLYSNLHREEWITDSAYSPGVALKVTLWKENIHQDDHNLWVDLEPRLIGTFFFLKSTWNFVLYIFSYLKYSSIRRHSLAAKANLWRHILYCPPHNFSMIDITIESDAQCIESRLSGHQSFQGTKSFFRTPRLKGCWGLKGTKAFRVSRLSGCPTL